MKAGVKEGDRIIKVSEVPSLGDAPPTAGGDASQRRGILWRWRGPSGLRWVWRNAFL